MSKKLPISFPLALMALGICIGCQPPALQPAPANGEASTVQAMQRGEIELQLTGLPGFRVAATGTDVSSLRVTVTGAQMGTPVISTVSTSKLISGQGRMTIGDLPPGEAVITVEALGSDQSVLGQGSVSVLVEAGKTARTSVAVKLRETVLGDTHGKAAVNVTLEDGIENELPLPVPSRNVDFPTLSSQMQVPYAPEETIFYYKNWIVFTVDGMPDTYYFEFVVRCFSGDIFWQHSKIENTKPNPLLHWYWTHKYWIYGQAQGYMDLDNRDFSYFIKPHVHIMLTGTNPAFESTDDIARNAPPIGYSSIVKSEKGPWLY